MQRRHSHKTRKMGSKFPDQTREARGCDVAFRLEELPRPLAIHTALRLWSERSWLIRKSLILDQALPSALLLARKGRGLFCLIRI